MTNATKKQLKKIDEKQEYLDNQTSWKFLEKKAKTAMGDGLGSMVAVSLRVQLEILKELQYMNRKSL